MVSAQLIRFQPGQYGLCMGNVQKGAGNDKQGKDAENRTLCLYRNFCQAIKFFIA